MDDLAILFGRPERAPDADDRFELEALAAEELGLDAFAIPLDGIVERDVERALRRLPRPCNRRWLYRGWMLSEDEYGLLYEAIADRDEELVVDPESFAEATYAPSWIPLLGAHTAASRWTDGESIQEAWEVAQELGAPPWIVKDHVKSAKEEWHRACFAPVRRARDAERMAARATPRHGRASVDLLEREARRARALLRRRNDARPLGAVRVSRREDRLAVLHRRRRSARYRAMVA